MNRAALLLSLGIALGGCATAPSSPSLQLAITIDDLPVHGPIPAGDSPQRVADELIAALRSGGAVQATGFVNGRWTAEDRATWGVLTAWRRAGLPLGNHGWAHRNLDDLTPADFEEELARNEPLLRELGGKSDWRWFRYPFLSEGKDPATRAAARAVLARKGYRIAAVTMDFSDWQWTGPYARCLASADKPGIERLERLYMEAAAKGIARSRQLSQAVYGRDIPYVVLLHSGAFTARMMSRLLALYRSQGFRFVGLDEAERDPAYATAAAPARPGPPATLEGQAAARDVPVPAAPVDGEAIAAVCA